MAEEPLKKKFDLINLGYDIATDSEKTMIRERVEQLLKEIEEEIKEYTVSASDVAFIQDKWKCDGIVRGLEIARGKIKKAFEGLE